MRQLLAAKDWRSALAVGLIIPPRYAVIRSKLIYEVLSLRASEMLGQREEDSVFIERELGLPAEWLSTSLALCEQNFNLYEAAMAEWHRAGNPQ